MAHSGQQQYQQPQQYQYPQQYQQIPQQYNHQQQQQYQPIQQGQQYHQPHQYQQQPQYGYQIQQQYPQQGYQQQYTQGFPQHQSYAPPQMRAYPQQPQSSHGPPAQAGAETCYNCGLPDHFAQDCPEPRREVPAGFLKRQKRHHIFKPQYNNSSINTNPQAIHGYQPPTQPQHAYPQHQQSYSPATPQSAQSPASNQWRHQNAWHHNQQVYQQNQQSPFPSQYQPQSPPYQPQPLATSTTPVPGPQFALPQPVQASPTASYHGSAVHTPQLTHTDQALLQQRAQPSMPVSQMYGTNVNDESSTVEDEPEEDDLNLLDIPDLPQSTKLFGEAVISRIGRPIPANFIVADALWPIQPPSIEAGGKCQSKYLPDEGTKAFLQNIKDSPYWKDHEEDTIFIEILNNGEHISIDDCRFRIKERQKHPTDNESQRKSRSQSRSLAPRSAEAAEMAESLETLERALAEAKAKQAEMIRNRKKSKQKYHNGYQEHQQQQIVGDNTTIKVEQQSPPQSAARNEVGQPPQDTEDILASLGVTGAPKPVPNPSRKVSQASPPHDATMHRSRSSSKEITNPFPSQYEQQPPHYHKNGTAPTLQHYGHPQHPPPPPPPIRTPSHNNAIIQSPDSGGMDPYGYGTNGVDNGNGYYAYGTDGQAASPTQYRSEQSLSRKRSYDQRESSSEESDSSRRQEDDITPKHKKRQPKVAAAYSRRW